MSELYKLGDIQRGVLYELDGNGPRSVSEIAWALPNFPLHGSVRAAVHSLEKRGLVDVAGFSGRARTFDVTAKGRTLLDPYPEEDSVLADE